MKKFVLAALLAASALVPVGANALTITQNVNIVKTPTDFTAPAGFAKFDGTLGALISVSISVATQFFTDYTVTNLGSAFAGNVGYVTPVPGDVPTGVKIVDAGLGISLLASVTGTSPINLPISGSVSGSLTGSGSDSDLLGGAAVNPFIDVDGVAGGLDTFTLSVVAQAVAAVLGSGNFNNTFSTVAGADIEVVYTYDTRTEVPAPATLALLGAALVGLGIARRRA